MTPVASFEAVRWVGYLLILLSVGAAASRRRGADRPWAGEDPGRPFWTPLIPMGVGAALVAYGLLRALAAALP